MQNSTIVAARQKGKIMPNNTMSRLDASEDSLWVYKFSNKLYVGYPVYENKSHLLDSSKSVIETQDDKGNVTNIFQSI